MHATSFRFGTALVALSGVLAVAACDDNPVDHHDEHLEAVGMAIQSAGVDLVVVEGTTVTGSLVVDVDGETADLTIHFIDDDGDRFTPDDDDQWLYVELADPAIAAWEPAAAGAFAGRLVGLGVGATTAVFELMHGPLNAASAHPDYTSPSITVVVEPDTTAGGV